MKTALFCLITVYCCVYQVTACCPQWKKYKPKLEKLDKAINPQCKQELKQWKYTYIFDSCMVHGKKVIKWVCSEACWEKCEQKPGQIVTCQPICKENIVTCRCAKGCATNVTVTEVLAKFEKECIEPRSTVRSILHGGQTETSKPALAETTTENATKEEVTSQAPTEESFTSQSPTDESMTSQSPTDESLTNQSPTDESVTSQSATEEAMTSQPATEGSVTSQSVTDGSVSSQPARTEPETSTKP